MTNFKIIFAAFLIGFFTICSQAQQQLQKIYLWPEGAPGAKGTAEEDKPSITVYPAPKELSRNAAVIVCPGGGYSMLAVDHEGDQIAKWYNTIGVTAFVLRYRVGKWDHTGYEHPIPFMDASRAMRLVRSRAKEWNIDPGKIGIMGFSAGGHLASTLGTHFDSGDLNSKNEIDRTTSRPNFLVLMYPVISFNTKYTHRGSRSALLGENPRQSLVDSLSNETQVTTLTPPTFLFHTTDDQAVPVENSVLFYMGCRNAGVPVEMHLYEKGPHGVGLAQNDPVLSSWPNRLRDWLRNQAMVKDEVLKMK